MRARHFILEYSREKTQQVHGEKIIQALQKDKQPRADIDIWNLHSRSGVWTGLHPNDKQDLLNKVFAQIEMGDPTKNKEYSQWLARMYSKQIIPLEDIKSKMRDALEWYVTLKLRKKLEPEHKDINQMKHPNDLLRAMENYSEEDLEAPITDRGSSREIYRDSEIRVIVPKDKAAACYYGQGTKWCTAARSNNMFDQYHKMGDMYIIMPNKPKYEGEKYQFHFQSGQFMDEQDREVDMYKVLKQYPSIRNIKTITDWAKRKIVPALMSDEDYAEWKKETNEHILRNRVMHGDMYTLSLNQPGTTLDTWKISRTTIEMLVEKNMMKGNSWANLAGTEYIAYGWFDAKSDACLGLTYAELGEEPESAVLTVSSVDFEKAEELSNEPEVEKLEKFLKGMVRIEDEAQTSGLAQEQYEKAINQLLDSYGYPMSATGYSGGEPERA